MDDDVVPYIGERTRIVRGIACTEAMGVEVFDDIPVTKTEGRRDEHVGRYVFAKYPLTTAGYLAVAVLKGEPCGRELADELIGTGAVDPDHAILWRVVERAFESFESERWPNRHRANNGPYWNVSFDELKAAVLAALST